MLPPALSCFLRNGGQELSAKGSYSTQRPGRSSAGNNGATRFSRQWRSCRISGQDLAYKLGIFQMEVHFLLWLEVGRSRTRESASTWPCSVPVLAFQFEIPSRSAHVMCVMSSRSCIVSLDRNLLVGCKKKRRGGPKRKIPWHSP